MIQTKILSFILLFFMFQVSFGAIYKYGFRNSKTFKILGLPATWTSFSDTNKYVAFYKNLKLDTFDYFGQTTTSKFLYDTDTQRINLEILSDFCLRAKSSKEIKLDLCGETTDGSDLWKIVKVDKENPRLVEIVNIKYNTIIGLNSKEDVRLTPRNEENTSRWLSSCTGCPQIN